MAPFRGDPARFDGHPLSTFTPIVAANNTDPGAAGDNSQVLFRQPVSWRQRRGQGYQREGRLLTPCERSADTD
jgi:hypothetical protein